MESYININKRSSITDNLNKNGDIEIRTNFAFLEETSSDQSQKIDNQNNCVFNIGDYLKNIVPFLAFGVSFYILTPNTVDIFGLSMLHTIQI